MSPLRCLVLVLVLLLTACGPAITPQASGSLSEGASVTPEAVFLRGTFTSTPTTIHPSPVEAAPATHTSVPSRTPAFTPTPDPMITLLFTGIIVPARCVQAAIDRRGDPDFIYEDVRDLIRQAHLAVGTLNATMSDHAPRTGCVSTYVLAGDPGNADAMARAGFDVMSVATNHIKNCGLGSCGDQAFFDTLANLKRAGILPVGAGANHAEAMQPVVVEVKGVRFGIVSLGQIEPMAFASDSSPGIAVLNDENLRQAISAARRVSDVVIAMPHWGPEYSPDPNPDQLHLARLAVEAGADLVVGNHTHVVQAVQQIDGVQVFYGLGNFVFDQDWSRETQQGVILQVAYEGARFQGYELIPTTVDGEGRVSLAGETEAAEILDRIETASGKLK